MTLAIRADRLSKRYRISRTTPRNGQPTGLEAAAASDLGVWNRWKDRFGRRGTREFWALEDVSFEIQAGEVVGIVGRNGAGKSTLLKILGRITRPTRGSARVGGRVGTLLEVGTGFHPELSGRENIFLNGAILGMRTSEIRRKFDEIVDFAEVEAFLETPVKRYSSGMYVRLAFAVAAHLQPEILLIDEVLAVGDVAFQKKCLSRMESLSHTNHTVLFVSHNLGSIRQLCRRSIVIDGGRVVHDGTTPEALRVYNELLRNITVDAETNLSDRLKRSTGAVRFTSICVENAAGEKEWDFHTGDTIRMRLAYEVYEPVDDLWFHFALQSGSHAEVISTVSEALSPIALPIGKKGAFLLEFPEVALRPGDYGLYFWLGSKLGIAYDTLTSQNASFPALTIWSDETDQRKTIGFFSLPARLVPIEE
ncbi:MAG TPA: ABC transporter ATP-binding protein [Planctomycetaceae bacterium]|jgi:lipopolysaccharide transport system ATP-binding protein|nr:ABC transporter ATP-binding protein [Planctomycetaceae bacterium]